MKFFLLFLGNSLALLLHATARTFFYYGPLWDRTFDASVLGISIGLFIGTYTFLFYPKFSLGLVYLLNLTAFLILISHPSPSLQLSWPKLWIYSYFLFLCFSVAFFLGAVMLFIKWKEYVPKTGFAFARVVSTASVVVGVGIIAFLSIFVGDKKEETVSISLEAESQNVLIWKIDSKQLSGKWNVSHKIPQTEKIDLNVSTETIYDFGIIRSRRINKNEKITGLLEEDFFQWDLCEKDFRICK